jgi:uncharacterized membrane protein SirB2
MTLEGLDNISGYSIIIIGLYLIIASTVSPFKVLGENVKNVIENNPIFQHIITFSLIFFIIVLLNKTPPSVPLQAIYAIIDSPNNNLLYLFGVSILIYILFIISSRASLMFTGLILILLFLLFVFNAMATKRKEEKNEEEYKKYKLAQNILFILIIIISLIGSVVYSIDKYKNNKDDFTLFTFILDNSVVKK